MYRSGKSHDGRYYKRLAGKTTCYHPDTPLGVVSSLEAGIRKGRHLRLRIWYGDHKTGIPWDEKPETGYIGRSTGNIKIPLLIKRTDSRGGEAIMDHRVLMISEVRTREILYKHPLLILKHNLHVVVEGE